MFTKQFVRISCLASFLVITSGIHAADFRENLSILRNFLDYPEEDVQKALQELAASQDPRAIEPMSELLEVPVASIRTAARQALMEMGAMEIFEQRLRSQDAQERRDTARVLRYMGSPAIPRLQQGLEDPDPRVRESIVVSLGHLARLSQDQQAVQALILALQDPSPYVQEASIVFLGELGGVSAVNPLSHFVKVNLLFSQASAALTQIASQNAQQAEAVIRQLKRLANGSDPGLSNRVAGVLGGIPHPQAQAALLELLSSQNAPVRFAVIQALVPLAKEPRVQAAVQRLADSDPDPLVRSAAGSFLRGELRQD